VTVGILQGMGLGYAYKGGPWILKDVDFSLGSAELVAIVGRSGVGKSTLLRLLAGLLDATTGEIRLGPNVELNARSLGYVPQNYALLPWLSAEANVEVSLLPLRLSANERHRRSRDALELVGGLGFSGRPVCHLSGGMQQRVALARALVGEPKAMLLDEPFSGVDWLTRQQMQVNLLELQARNRLAMAIVTHDLDEALRLADRLVVLDGAPARIVRSIPIEVARVDRDEPKYALPLAELRADLLNELWRPSANAS